MSRLPLPEEVSVADAIAFDAFTPEQKRIAIAGVAIHQYLEDHIETALESARSDAHDEGYAERGEQIAEGLHAALDKLALVRQKVATADSRYTELGEVIADLTKLVTP